MNSKEGQTGLEVARLLRAGTALTEDRSSVPTTGSGTGTGGSDASDLCRHLHSCAHIRTHKDEREIWGRERVKQTLRLLTARVCTHLVWVFLLSPSRTSKDKTEQETRRGQGGLMLYVITHWVLGTWGLSWVSVAQTQWAQQCEHSSRAQWESHTPF